MNDRTMPPLDSPSEAELTDLLRAGREQLGAVAVDRLAEIWRAVDDELDLEEPTVRTAVDGASDDSADPDADRRTVITTDGPATTPAVARARRRWSTVVPAAAAAAVALVVGVGAGLALAPDADSPTQVALASWDLEPFGDAPVETTGALLTEEDGVRTVQLSLTDLPPTSGFHEVWLLDPTTGALTSLGPVRPDGRYVVPTGTDLTTLTALDVSAEPLDGDPGHSGASLLRGEVTFLG